MRIRRRAAAEQAQRLSSGDLMPGSRRNEDGGAGGDGAFLAIDLHRAVTFEDEIELLAQLVEMPLCGAAHRHRRLGQRLILHGGIGSVQDTTDGAAIFGGKGRLLGKKVDGHAE